ncbi:MAG: LemA family protein [Prevotella sp.]|nr:LemA family protein [Prevotella sp.]MCM1074750.1 LemA family protein [Ruminococcus sp.]
MKKKYLPWIIIGGIVVILIAWIATSYNGMYNAEQDVEQKWGDLQSQYQRRKDLIPNLENTVKSYAKYEGETLTAVTEARANAHTTQQLADALPKEAPTDAQALANYMKVQDDATKALNLYVNAVKEAYPDLKANQNYLEFQENLTGTENRIQVARTNYNEAVTVYNKKVGRFPNVMIAGMLGFDKRSTFQAEAGAQYAPAVFND